MLWESELGEAWMILCCKKWEKDGAELLKISPPEVSQLAPENRPNPKKEKNRLLFETSFQRRISLNFVGGKSL